MDRPGAPPHVSIADARRAQTRSVALRERAESLMQQTQSLIDEATQKMSTHLAVVTCLSDDGNDWPNRAHDLHRACNAVGRDPIIERAKAVVAKRAGISRGDAITLLKDLSTRQNRRLRDLAHDIVDRRRAGG